MKKILLIFLFLLSINLYCTDSYAASLFNSNSDIYNGSDEEQSTDEQDLQDISDVMRAVPEENNANIDADSMAAGKRNVNYFAGTIISIIVYIIFAMLGFTTACDLVYLSIPSMRPILNRSSGTQQPNTFSGNMQMNRFGSQQSGNSEFCLVSDTAKNLLNNQNMQNMRSNYMNYNRGNNQQKSNSQMLALYFKERSVSIVIIITVLILLVSTSVFTDFGLNIGEFLYDLFMNLLGLN